MKPVKDPRREPSFKPALFPSCDGQDASRQGREGRLPKVKLHFLAAYYRINAAYAALVAQRKSRGGKSASKKERRLLQRIEEAIVAKERLEDRHAPHGIVASPVYRDGYAV